jgi:molybdopterin synthase sulfur carrier subunit
MGRQHMVIRVKGYLTFRARVGDRQIEVGEGATLRELLERLEAEVEGSFTAPATGGRGGPQRRFLVLINGRHSSHLPDGSDTELKDGDQVDLFPPIAGGKT